MVGGRLTRWSCHRLECLAEFIRSYHGSLKNGGCIVELYAGPVTQTCKESECAPECLEIRLLKDKNSFSRIILLAKNPDETSALKGALKSLDKNGGVHVITGNCMHEAVMRQVFDLIPRSTQSLALINPPGYASLRWSVIKKLAQHGTDWQGHKMDLCVIFPVEMALLRNLLRPECQNSINRLYGSENWQAVREKCAGHTLNLDQARRELVEAYKSQLKKLGYKLVEDIEPARFTSPPYYHIVWASDRTSRLKELREIWGKEKFLPCEMFHEGKPERG